MNHEQASANLQLVLDWIDALRRGDLDSGTRVGSSQPTLGDAGSIREAALVIVDYASSPPIVDEDKEE